MFLSRFAMGILFALAIDSSALAQQNRSSESLSSETANQGFDPVFYTGVRLKKVCDDKQYGDHFCLGFIIAAHDLNMVAKHYGKRVFKDHYCLPNTGDAFQMAETVKKWMNENPQSLHMAAVTVVYAALRTYFPC